MKSITVSYIVFISPKFAQVQRPSQALKPLNFPPAFLQLYFLMIFLQLYFLMIFLQLYFLMIS